MIYATGIVSFLSKSNAPKSKVYMKNSRVHMEIIEIADRHVTAEGIQSIEVTCRFKASLNEDYDCKSLEDYNGKVKPFLQRYIKNLIYRVEVHDLRYG